MSIFVKATRGLGPKTPETAKVVLLYAGLLIVFAVLQLLSFDGMLRLFESFWMPGGRPFAHFLVMFIIVAEVFALPFLFRMKLSPLARGMSMILGWLVPVLWLMVTLWVLQTLNVVDNIGLLGAMIHILPGWCMVCIDLALGILAAWTSWGLWPYRRGKKLS